MAATVKRQSINIRNVDKGAQPIPMGAKFGNVVYSSPIPPHDPDLNAVPEDADGQARALFKNIRAFVEAAGASQENIVHMSISIRDPKYRDNLNPEWLKMFPDPESRPARRIVVTNRPGSESRPGQTLFHADLVLYIP